MSISHSVATLSKIIEIISNQVTLGEHNRKEKGEGNLAELDVPVKKLIVHPKFDFDTLNNDIVILYLAQESIQALL